MKSILVYGPSLQKEIRLVIASEKAVPSYAGSWRTDFLKRLVPYATSGKLLRGSLVCFSYEAFAGQQPNQAVRDVAVGLELIHSALLIHDDVMDNDDFRRGKPSLHRQYAAAGRKKGLVDTERFGANMAICGADMCLFMAVGLLTNVQNNPETPPSVNKLFTKILVEVCDGQMQDIYSQARPDLPSKQAIYNLMKSKTASYTLSLPLAAGAALAGQPQAVLQKLQRIGDAAGTIFQVRDDELGAMGDTAQTGKPVGADIREGKKTLIYYYLMKTCNSGEKQTLQAIFGNPHITPNDIAAVQKLIKKRRVPQLLNAEVKRFEGKALKVLHTLDLPAPHKAELKSLITFCAKRQT